MAKDRARPFSRKHRKYWIPVTGGMIVIGLINVGLGWCTYTPPPAPPEHIQVLPEDRKDPAREMAEAAAKRALAKRAAEEAARRGSGSATDAGAPEPTGMVQAPPPPK